MNEWIVFGWLVFLWLVSMNGFAAGVVAIFHAWRSKMARGSRVILASALAGVLPTGFMIIVPAAEAGFGNDLTTYFLIVGGLFAVSAVLALPGATLVATKLESPGSDYRSFE